MELKILLALLVRYFKLIITYKELDVVNKEQDRKNNVKIAIIKTVDEERAYQVGNGEPSAFLSCRVREIVKEWDHPCRSYLKGGVVLQLIHGRR